MLEGKDLKVSFWRRYKFIIYPVVVVVLLLACMLILTEGPSVAPALYNLF